MLFMAEGVSSSVSSICLSSLAICSSLFCALCSPVSTSCNCATVIFLVWAGSRAGTAAMSRRNQPKRFMEPSWVKWGADRL